MARQTDNCMFCDALPCVCGKPKSVVRIPSKAQKPATPVAPVAKPIPAAPVSIPKSPSKIVNLSSPDDAEMARAITVLAEAELLHRDELVKHRRAIAMPSYKIDALIWRQDVEADRIRRHRNST